MPKTTEERTVPQSQETSRREQGSREDHLCPHCQATGSRKRVSFREVAVNAACLALLIAMLIWVSPLVEHWIDLAAHRVTEQLLWREPLESWD